MGGITGELAHSETQKKTQWKALDNHVIAVAVEGFGQDWSAYIAAVPGKDFEKEWKDVEAHGSKLDQKLAELLFPSFQKSGLEYRG